MGHPAGLEEENPLLRVAAADVRRDVATRLQSLRYNPGHIIMDRGGPPGDVYFIRSGEAQITIYSLLGRQITVHTIGAGEMVGDLAAFDGGARSASVLAATELRLVRMSRADFRLCIESSPAAALWLAERLASGMRRLTERVYELTVLNVQMRVQCELLRIARAGREVQGIVSISPAPTHLELANRVGTNREAVTREIRALCEARILRTGRRSIEFIDVARLEQAVQRATA
ncbi:MAG: Crp/Fnr family transcriptional regulator [Sphingomonas sp.]